MACEKRVDPIGPDAPCDLSGMDGNFELQKRALIRLIVCLTTGSTPMGRATLRSSGKPTSQIQESLFLPGDKSILPHTPHTIRAGKSPWKGSHSQSSSDNIIYAFSEASGWTPQMEDRVLVACPVAGAVQMFYLLQTLYLHSF